MIQITDKDYATIQRAVGLLEGATLAIEDSDVKQAVYDAIEMIDAALKGEGK